MGTVKYTGPVASFHCPTNAEIRSLKVHFSPKQEGTGDPSPENIRTINGTNGLITYKTGKNLFNVDRIEGSPNPTNLSNSTSPRIMDCAHYFVGLQSENYYYKNYTIATVSNGTITVTNKNNNSYGVGFPVCVKSNTTYTLSFTAQSSMVSFGYYDNEWNYLSTSTGSTSENPRTVTTPEKTCYMVIVFRAPQSETATYTYSNIQLELGSTATPYEPYLGETINYTFGVLGKNKLDKSSYKYLNSSIICFGGDTSAEPDGSLFLKAGIYTFSVNATGTIFATDANKRNIAFATDTNTITFTLQESIAVRIVCSFQGATDEEMLAYNYQLELGSTATEYEPYNPNHTVYGGWVDLITGEVEEEYGMVETTWGAMGGADVRGNYERRQLNVSSIGFIGASAGNLNNRPNRRFCNIAPWRWAYYDDQLHYYADMGIAYVFLPINSDDNITIRIVCYLATPNTYNLAPIELQTFLGQNNVWSNADYVEVEYDLHETQDILARKQFIMANQPHIVTPAAAPLQNFVTDVPAPLKECKVYFEPKQDLHGYSNPWSAGGGKNIAKPYDNSYVSSTYISFDYSASTGTFHCSGSASASSSHSSPSASNAISNNATFTLPAGTYTLSIIDGDGTYIYAQCVSSTETVLAETTSHISFTTNEALTVFVRLKVAAGGTVDNTVKIQLEAGSAATSYVPYENICPISGWTGVTACIAGNNLLNEAFLSDINNYPVVGAYEYRYTNPIFLAPNTKYRITFTQSVRYETARYWAIKVYSGEYDTYDKPGTVAYLINGTYRINTIITTGSSGVVRFAVYGGQSTLNDIWSNTNVQMELGETATSYEPYFGTTIPITFPATKNLFDETYENISGNVTYKSLYVGNNAVTASSDMPLATNSYSNLFILPGQVTSGASTGENNFNLGKTRTVTPIDGYVTIGYRNNYDIDPRNYHAQIEQGSVATTYEPYGTIYGGYMDLIKGKIVKTHELISLKASGLYTNNSDLLFWYTSGIQSLNTTNEGVFCNKCKLITNVSGKEHYSCFVWYSNGIIRWVEEGTMNMTLNEYKNYLDTHPLLVTYKLKTPIEFPISNEVLKTLRGTNNVWSNANGNIDLSYWKH